MVDWSPEREGRELLMFPFRGVVSSHTGSALTYSYPRVVTLPPRVELPDSKYICSRCVMGHEEFSDKHFTHGYLWVKAVEILADPWDRNIQTWGIVPDPVFKEYIKSCGQATISGQQLCTWPLLMMGKDPSVTDTHRPLPWGALWLSSAHFHLFALLRLHDFAWHMDVHKSNRLKTQNTIASIFPLCRFSTGSNGRMCSCCPCRCGACFRRQESWISFLEAS